ncbi:MAG: hypothetical protein ACI9DJ_003507 [Algoriphagus sp.]|jgi:hypothetical protein
MAKHRLFTLSIDCPSMNPTKSFFFSCVMVKDRVATFRDGKVKPLLFMNPGKEIMRVLDEELEASKGALTRQNYELFMPYMPILGYNKRGYTATDLEMKHMQGRSKKPDFSKTKSNR